MTLGELHRRFRSRFDEIGYAEAFHELLDIHFHLPPQAVWTRGESELPASACRNFCRDMKRFEDGTPLAHISGRAFFHALEFAVTPQVLIPRQDSECLLEQSLKRCAGETSLLDIGCGSGILSICLALERPQARIHALDSSFSALILARQNACRHGVQKRICFHHADLFPAGSLCPEEGFDIILSNPPYISRPEWPKLDPSVREHEPVAALYGGLDGLDCYRRIIGGAPAFLKPGGYLLFEMGYRQADALSRLLQVGGFSNLERYRDTGGHERVLAARWGVGEP